MMFKSIFRSKKVVIMAVIILLLVVSVTAGVLIKVPSLRPGH